jgi:hypothetical protein
MVCCGSFRAKAVTAADAEIYRLTTILKKQPADFRRVTVKN